MLSNHPSGSSQGDVATVRSSSSGSRRKAHRSLPDPKTAVVVLLEPDFPRLARWIVSACREAGGNQPKCQRVMFDAGQNGGNWQIPVAGVVYEDMKTSFFVQAPYLPED